MILNTATRNIALRNNLARRILLYFLIFLGTFLIYKNIYPDPRNWYDHYLYQARSFIDGRTDIPNLPDYFQDKIVVNGNTYTPFPPMPAILLTPIVKLWPDVTQQQVSIIIGAINAVLVFILLSKFTTPKKSFLLTLFFAFGTVAFWSAVVGTTWYFAHNVAVSFFLLSLIFFKNKNDFISGLFFALAVLSRYPILLGGVFFLAELLNKKGRLIRFLSGAFLCIPAQLIYDYIRFGSFFETGYFAIYKQYVGGGYPVTFLKLIKPDANYFGYIDIRNIPLHLLTFLIFPPLIDQALNIMPSPYGMGIVFTSPLLLLALKPPFKNIFERNLFLGAMAVVLIDFMHYAQGWVQFGYRFLLDFLPFLIIILALRFKIRFPYIFLLIFSIFVSTWGTLQAIKLGW